MKLLASFSLLFSLKLFVAPEEEEEEEELFDSLDELLPPDGADLLDNDDAETIELDELVVLFNKAETDGGRIDELDELQVGAVCNGATGTID